MESPHKTWKPNMCVRVCVCASEAAGDLGCGFMELKFVCFTKFCEMGHLLIMSYCLTSDL